MRNIKRYTDHLRESEDAPSSIKERLDNLWVVYYKEEDKYHFIAAYEDQEGASSRFMEEAHDWHGDSIDAAIQMQLDQEHDEYGEGYTPSELYNSDPSAYYDLWAWAVEYVQNHEEGEGREYACRHLKHVESDMESTGRGDDLNRFISDMLASEEVPDWAKDAMRKRQSSRGAFGRF